MPISDEHKLIFIHIPKNAGTSITNTIGMTDIGHHRWQYYKLKYHQKWESYTKISIIRNPWERVVSCYEYAKMEESYWHAANGKARAGKHLDYDLLKDKSFEDCLMILKKTPTKLRHQGWTNQLDYISDGNNIMVDHLIEIGKINQELSYILDIDIEIPFINKSNSTDYRKYYSNDNMVNIVKDSYHMDIKYLNFKF